LLFQFFASGRGDLFGGEGAEISPLIILPLGYGAFQTAHLALESLAKTNLFPKVFDVS
jgi:hypothetical protein